MFDQPTSGKHKPTVLVIAPSAANRTQICECLYQLPDIRTIATGDGKQALTIIQETWPSMVLLDDTLQGMDGISLTRTIRSWEQSRDEADFSPWTPIVLLSAVNDEDILARGILAGADDFLYKPVSEVVLLAKVRAMLRIATRQQEICAVHRQLKEIAILDSLTGIPNRRHFDDTLAAEWKRCIRTESPLSIVISDVDFFKQFNDIYGHQAGDVCLKAVASSLSESLFRVEDTVARYGGEEFVAILPGTDANGAYAVAERMRLSARDLCIPHQQGIGGRISCSFGVASTRPSIDKAPQQLLRTADAGLYAAKRAGRNRVALNQ
ncbi:diguanylate cyclase [Ferribacterium limneticum]|uniref:diguanylate cyclase n=1 Tax=Ferribacterium limneticum TaxID=76259 RepID=UPI001CFB8F67|nr:diguanylate cyclase [Ferribacterium limneticum]UCV27710.1 diguanylate cyclase [Ferribacterium limneticum]UCV31627.1 diguanylate cyclase [Ferribacterium limneticum]